MEKTSTVALARMIERLRQDGYAAKDMRVPGLTIKGPHWVIQDAQKRKRARGWTEEGAWRTLLGWKADEP